MLRLVVFALLVSAKAQDLLGVDYSFDIDFYRNFNGIKCDNESEWRLVSYKSLNVEVPSSYSDKGIQALGESCTSSFPIAFFNGALEFNVYLQVISNTFRISFEVFDECDKPVSRRYYGQSSKGFESGWQKVYLRVNKNVTGYVKIRGRSLKNEIILIDSFRYTPKTGNGHHHKNYKRSVKEDDAEIIFKFKNLNKHYRDNANQNRVGGIGDEAYTDEMTTDLTQEITNAPTEAPIIVAPDSDDSIWNPLTIFLVTFGAVVFLALVAVSAYHLGKLKSMDSTSQILAEDVEPIPTITIPRVTGVHENRLTSLILD